MAKTPSKKSAKAPKKAGAKKVSQCEWVIVAVCACPIASKVLS